MNKIYKYSTILLLIMTSGILFIVIGLIENSDFRYKIYDLFQVGISELFNLVDWKMNSNKDNTIWISNNQIAPIVNLISSILWTGLITGVILLVTRKTIQIDFKLKGFWTKVVLTNLIISGFLFLFWLLFMDTDFIYEGVYSKSDSIFKTIYNWVITFLYLPSFIPGLIGSIALDNGGDTPHGYEDMYLTSKTMTSFAVTFWSILGVWTFEKIIKLKTKKIKTPAVNSK